MYQLFIWGERNDLDVGNIHLEGHWKRCALKIRNFLGPEMASEASATWAQKSALDRPPVNKNYYT
jgi:hypothetical protein